MSTCNHYGTHPPLFETMESINSMTKNLDTFIKSFDNELIKNKHIKRANIPYGSIVIPILRIYRDLSDYDEKRSFEAALEAFLASPDAEKRRFAIDICLGFLIFKDVI